MSEETERITSDNGGQRQVTGERWDLIPGGFQSLAEVANIAHYGEQKYYRDNWKKTDQDTEQNAISHGVRHAYEALELEPGSDARVRALAKAAWNMLAAIWFEKQTAKRLIAADTSATESDDPPQPSAPSSAPFDNWFAKLKS